MTEYIDRNSIEWYECSLERPSCKLRECSRCSHAECSHSQVMQLSSIKVPDNPTNGDMIMTMFPDYEIKISSGQVCLYYPVTEEYSGSWIKFDLDWWNAPYKKEVEG